MLAFDRSAPVWCLGSFLGWIAIPLMNANLDAILRLTIPESMQGRGFAALWLMGVGVCVAFGKNRQLWKLEEQLRE